MFFFTTSNSFSRALLTLTFAYLAIIANARPSQFENTSNNQISSEGEIVSNNHPLIQSDDAVENGGLIKPWQTLRQWHLEMLAQKLAELNNQHQLLEGGSPNALDNTYWNRQIRGNENKRQSRYRQCYFNPISCFK